MNTFRHEAFLYADDSEYVRGTSEFIAEGLGAGEAVLVMVGAERIRELRSALAGDARRVHFADMRSIGTNPARIIPAWRDFAAAHDGRAVRGVGEPIWADRRPAELVEAQCHEMLLNVAFADRKDLRLLCPYDVAGLSPDAIAHAYVSHPTIDDRDGSEESGAYCDDVATTVMTRELCAAPPLADALEFSVRDLRAVRAFVSCHAMRHGLDPQRAASFVLAVDEVATNSVRYGGGSGVVRCWDEDACICEIRDAGRIRDPMVGRVRPALEDVGGRGLWIANQVCDLVQIRSDASGTTVRLHAR